MMIKLVINKPKPMPIGVIKFLNLNPNQYCMALIPNTDTYVLKTIFNKELKSIALSKNGNLLSTMLTVTADKIINKVNSVKQKRIIR